ncbi:MAG: hypothetical protein ACFFCO_08795, partial [Promethearchaeota archaeon]
LGAANVTASSQQSPPIYGYRAGDHYEFSENITETLDTPEEHLLWQHIHDIDVRILEIRENVGGYAIRIKARVTDFVNISYDLPNYYSTQYLEGYTPIVARACDYFTHTEWEIHLTDWNLFIDGWQANSNLVGFREQDLDEHYFHWNFTQWIISNISTTDIDNDGETDPYQAFNCYTARFTAGGVVLLRRFYTAIRFTCGIRHTRTRTVEQKLPLTTSIPSIPTMILLLIPVITVSCIVVFVITLFTRRRKHSTIPPQRRRRS